MDNQPSFGTLEVNFVLNASRVRDSCVSVFKIDKKDALSMYERMCRRLFYPNEHQNRIRIKHHFVNPSQFLSWFIHDRIDLNDDFEVFVSDDLKKVNPELKKIFIKSFPSSKEEAVLSFLNYLLEISRRHLKGNFSISLVDPLGDIK